MNNITIGDLAKVIKAKRPELIGAIVQVVKFYSQNKDTVTVRLNNSTEEFQISISSLAVVDVTGLTATYKDVTYKDLKSKRTDNLSLSSQSHSVYFRGDEVASIATFTSGRKTYAAEMIGKRNTVYDPNKGNYMYHPANKSGGFLTIRDAKKWIAETLIKARKQSAQRQDVSSVVVKHSKLEITSDEKDKRIHFASAGRYGEFIANQANN